MLNKEYLKKKSKMIFILIVLLGFGFSIIAQEVNPNGKSYKVLPYLSYGIDIPNGDLKDRFESNSALHGGLDLIFKNNMSFGMFFKYKFGENLKEDVFKDLRTSTGGILSQTEGYANVVLAERGLYSGIQLGKIFPIILAKKHIDIKMDFGIGYMSHYISINDSFDEVPQIEEEFKKGYDRLTSGIAINQSLSIHYVATNNWRLFLSIESVQGFTSSARNIQYDSSWKPDKNRKDIYTGLHLGFVLPFSFGTYAEDVYY